MFSDTIRIYDIKSPDVGETQFESQSIKEKRIFRTIGEINIFITGRFFESFRLWDDWFRLWLILEQVSLGLLPFLRQMNRWKMQLLSNQEERVCKGRLAKCHGRGSKVSTCHCVAVLFVVHKIVPFFVFNSFLRDKKKPERRLLLRVDGIFLYKISHCDFRVRRSNNTCVRHHSPLMQSRRWVNSHTRRQQQIEAGTQNY